MRTSVANADLEEAHRHGRLIRRALLACTAAAALLFGAMAAPASASASGCSSWNNYKIGSVWIAQGYMCSTLAGQGTYVASVQSSFASGGNICNWNVTAEFFDTSGRWYQTYSSPTHYSCNVNGTDGVTLNRYVQRGKMCSTLKSNGSRVSSVCHNIY